MTVNGVEKKHKNYAVPIATVATAAAGAGIGYAIPKELDAKALYNIKPDKFISSMEGKELSLREQFAHDEISDLLEFKTNSEKSLKEAIADITLSDSKNIKTLRFINEMDFTPEQFESIDDFNKYVSELDETLKKGVPEELKNAEAAFKNLASDAAETVKSKVISDLDEAREIYFNDKLDLSAAKRVQKIVAKAKGGEMPKETAIKNLNMKLIKNTIIEFLDENVKILKGKLPKFHSPRFAAAMAGVGAGIGLVVSLMAKKSKNKKS